jgi:hypothetical protein
MMKHQVWMAGPSPTPSSAPGTEQREPLPRSNKYLNPVFPRLFKLFHSMRIFDIQ